MRLKKLLKEYKIKPSEFQTKKQMSHNIHNNEYHLFCLTTKKNNEENLIQKVTTDIEFFLAFLSWFPTDEKVFTR